MIREAAAAQVSPILNHLNHFFESHEVKQPTAQTRYNADKHTNRITIGVSPLS